MSKSEKIMKQLNDEELEILNLCFSSDNVMEAMRIYGHIPSHGKDVFHTALKNENDSRYVETIINDKHSDIIVHLQPYTESYITSNIFSGEVCKGDAHWKICELLCEYVTGRKYGVSQGSLKLFIHKITTPITDHLNTTIDLPYHNSFTLNKKINIKHYARELSVCLLKAIDSENSDELAYHATKSEG